MKLDLITNSAIRPLEDYYSSSKQNNDSFNESKDVFGTETSLKVVKPVSDKIINEAVKKANKEIASTNTRLELTIFKPTHEVIVKIKDNETGKVIREIPSKKVLEMAVYMRKMAGIVVDEQI